MYLTARCAKDAKHAKVFLFFLIGTDDQENQHALADNQTTF